MTAVFGHRLAAPKPARHAALVKVIAVIAALVVLVLIIGKLSGGNHGPGRHAPRGHGASITAPVAGSPDHAAARARTA